MLVNLTFPCTDVRRDLAAVGRDDDEKNPSELVESLAFALRIASLTKDEYEARLTTIEDCNVEETNTAADRLVILMAEDQRLRVQPELQHQEQQLQQRAVQVRSPPTTAPPQQLFPETTRWCLAALRNLTRPSKGAEAAHILIRSSTVSLILQFINVVNPASTLDPKFFNAPSTWSSNSIQDIALSIILNLSACSSSREYISEASTIKTLSNIVTFPCPMSDGAEMTEEERRQMIFQGLKAVSDPCSIFCAVSLRLSVDKMHFVSNFSCVHSDL